MMIDRRLIIAIASSIAINTLLLNSAQAEQLVIPVGSQDNPDMKTALPKKGLSQRDVEARYGEPTRRTTPVGEPPVSRWHYPAFTVYFEHDSVIHSVLRRHTSDATD